MKKKDKTTELQRVCGDEKVLQYLDSTDFYTAPASTRFHGAYEGGLCEHSLHVYTRLNDLLAMHGSAAKKTALRVGLLHDLCKTGFYKTAKKAVKENGRWVEKDVYVVEDSYPMGHGEKSVVLCYEAGIDLSREEAMAIRWHMGAYKNTPAEMDAIWRKESSLHLCLLTHLADNIATQMDDDAPEENSAKKEPYTPKTAAFMETLKAEIGENLAKVMGDKKTYYNWLFKRFVLNRAGAKKLLAYLNQSDFFTAPAAIGKYAGKEGGSCAHSLQFLLYLLKMVDYLEIDATIEEIVATALLSNIGNVATYVPEVRHRKVDGQWEDYTVYNKTEEIPYGSLGAKSVFMAQPFVRLSRRESQSIRWHMGAMDGDAIFPCSRAFELDKFVFAAHIAWMMATYI